MTRVGGCNNEVAASLSDHYTEVLQYYSTACAHKYMYMYMYVRCGGGAVTTSA